MKGMLARRNYNPHNLFAFEATQFNADPAFHFLQHQIFLDIVQMEKSFKSHTLLSIHSMFVIFEIKRLLLFIAAALLFVYASSE